MSVARCPGSCGELIQGWILGSEKLVSCPIDWYSTVEVCDGIPRADERPLTRAMVEALLVHFGFPQALSPTLRIEVDSTLPIAKGMASSTADIAATAVAAAHHLGVWPARVGELELGRRPNNELAARYRAWLTAA